jgi:hypothetical protein
MVFWVGMGSFIPTFLSTTFVQLLMNVIQSLPEHQLTYVVLDVNQWYALLFGNRADIGPGHMLFRAQNSGLREGKLSKNITAVPSLVQIVNCRNLAQDIPL